MRVESSTSKVLLPVAGHPYPVAVRGEGAWVEDVDGERYLDAMSGGSMAATIGFGRSEVVEAGRAQALAVAHVHNERLTNGPQERLAERLVQVAGADFTRVRFVTGGAEANEMALQIARTYHVERGEPERWRIISPAQAYHGPTFATLALAGRPGLHGPFSPYIPAQLHIPPSTWRFDPSGEAALAAVDALIEEHGAGSIAAFFCEPVSAAALPGYSPPPAFWKGLDERRARHGFLVCFDEVVTGMGRTGTWFAFQDLPIVPDIVTTAKGLGAGYAAVGAVLCREGVYQAIASGSRRFTLGHSWDGSPFGCAVGLAVMDVIEREGLVDRVAARGPKLHGQLAAALEGIDMVREVRGKGYLLGIEYVDPDDGESFLPPELGVAGRVDAAALDQGLVLYSTQPTRDGLAGDQSLFAPAFSATDDELELMVERSAAAIASVAARLPVTEAG